jgi:hypothetical protein
MLCVNKYTQKYIDDCRLKVADQVQAYQALAKAANVQVEVGHPKLKTAIEEFEPHFFNNLVLVLEGCFVHRARGKEMKDGNPLNEVRMLANSLMSYNDTMSEDRTIKYNPEKSVLKYAIGDSIKLREADFLLLSEAFFAEIESKYL